MLTQYDRDLASAWILEIGTSGAIELQFPPRMTGDSRAGNWNEVPMRSKDPQANFLTAEPRIMNIEIIYIVGENGWDGPRVSQNVQAMKAYFLQVNKEGTPGLVTQFKFVLHGGTKMSGRLHSVNVDYSSAYIGKGNNAYPLRAVAKLDARVWTKGQPPIVDAAPHQKPIPPVEWA